jgi:hypothetical protein
MGVPTAKVYEGVQRYLLKFVVGQKKRMNLCFEKVVQQLVELAVV